MEIAVTDPVDPEGKEGLGGREGERDTQELYREVIQRVFWAEAWGSNVKGLLRGGRRGPAKPPRDLSQYHSRPRDGASVS